MPLREPPLPLTLSFATASAASPAIKDAAAAGATILDQCLQLPKLNLGSCSARSSASRPKFLASIEPLQPPFTARPPWCLALETYDKPRAVVLLDVYKDHEFLTTHTVYHKSAYLIGRNAAICDIVLSHCSISRLHAALFHHEDGVSVYLVDLGSAHGTSVDGLRLTPLQPTLLIHGAQLKFGASSRSYTFKTFDSREQIAAIVRAQVGLDDDELTLNHNTLLNRALSYRLELSPSRESSSSSSSDDPMAPAPLQPLEHVPHERRSSTDDLTLSLAAFQHDEPARKRSRGQSGNSQGSSDHSMGRGSDVGANQLMLAVFDDDDDDLDGDAAHGVPKRVHFTPHAPVEIPPPPLSPLSPVTGTGTPPHGAASGADTTRVTQSSESLALRLGGLTALTIPTQPQDACS